MLVSLYFDVCTITGLIYSYLLISLATPTTASLQTTAPPVLSPVADSEVNLQIIVAVVAVAMVILLLMVVVAMVILVLVVRKARLSKAVVMLGNTSPIENPSYSIGKSPLQITLILVIIPVNAI